MNKAIFLTFVLCVCVMAGTMKDSRDGKTYKTVKIGNQVWMAENLNYNTKDSYCYDNNSAKCNKYGRLYMWKAAKEACPSGWHLPSKKEFEELYEFAGGEEDIVGRIVRKKLSARNGWPSDRGGYCIEYGCDFTAYGNGTQTCNPKEKKCSCRRGRSVCLETQEPYNYNGSDTYGFSALPAGDYYGNSKKFDGLGSGAGFWSSTEYSGNGAYYLYFSEYYANVSSYGKTYGYSVRCLQDSNEGSGASSQRSQAQSSSATASSKPSVDRGTMTDSRDGKTYKTVKIGDQTWMAENLNYNTGNSWCYGNNSSNCNKYGRLYDWKTAMNACPSGWHLPNDGEWNTLWTAVGGTNTAGTKLKSKNGWNANGNGTDSFGFAVLPAGRRHDDGYFYNEGYYADFWGSSEGNSYDAYYWRFNYGSDNVNRYNNNKGNGFSVRCLWDSNEGSGASSQRSQAQPSSATANQIVSGDDTMTDSRDGKTYKTVKIGDQTWMAENLNYNTENSWYKTGNSWCYDNNSSNCNKYGRLYDWNMARSACPSGWHLPSDDEWNTLWTAVGGTNTAGTKLKSKNGWNSNGNGTDSFGFAVLPAGSRNYPDDNFFNERKYAGFWSSTALSSNGDAYNWDFRYFSDGVGRYSYDKRYGFSVRCLRNSNE